MAITRATELAGLGTIFDALADGGGLSVSGISTFTDLNVTRVNVTGVSTFATLNITNSNPTQLNVTGVTTTARLVGTAVSVTAGGLVAGIGTINNLNSTHINISGVTTVSAGSASAPSITPTGDSNTGIFFPTSDYLSASTSGTERVTIDSSGNINIDSGTVYVDAVNNSLAIGTTLVQGTTKLQVQDGEVFLRRSLANASINTAGIDLGFINFGNQDGGVGTQILAEADAAWGSGAYPGRLVFSTTSAYAAGPTERMRIASNGTIRINTGGNTPGPSQNGTEINNAGYIFTSVGADTAAFFNRNTNDGTIVALRQDNTDEGSISVSGTTVSYNGAHLSRWSQLPGGAERTEILRGTVLSNIDEMCGWGDEENEQLNRMKVSDVEGDINVSGVFQAWDDDDDTYTDDFYCAMTGDFIIRIAAGTPAHKGQLLMSAGDGTAKPQDDDIVRSKTIAKVTSSHVTCTYDDGSYCVPCVLMAC